MIPVSTDPNMKLVEATDQLAPRIQALTMQLMDLMNQRFAAIDEKFPQVSAAVTQEDWLKIPADVRAGFMTTKDLELFVQATVMGAMAASISKSMDPSTKGLFSNLANNMPMWNPVAPGHTLVVRYIPIDPPGACDDPTCAACRAKREKEFRERA